MLKYSGKRKGLLSQKRGQLWSFFVWGGLCCCPSPLHFLAINWWTFFINLLALWSQVRVDGVLLGELVFSPYLNSVPIQIICTTSMQTDHLRSLSGLPWSSGRSPAQPGRRSKLLASSPQHAQCGDWQGPAASQHPCPWWSGEWSPYHAAVSQTIHKLFTIIEAAGYTPGTLRFPGWKRREAVLIDKGKGRKVRLQVRVYRQPGC